MPVTLARGGQAIIPVDVYGGGMTALVWAEQSRDEESAGCIAYRFANGTRPYLLTGIDNGMGGLTSIDYAKMPPEVKAQESAPRRSDSDYALSYIRREGTGRVFVEVLGHDESIYKLAPMLAHILAGVQYAIGDLPANDTPDR